MQPNLYKEVPNIPHQLFNRLPAEHCALPVRSSPFNGNIIGLFLNGLLSLRYRQGKNTIFIFRMDILFLNPITDVEAPAYISGVTLTAYIFAFFILLILIQPLSRTDGQVSILQLDLDLIFLESRQINGDLIGVILFLHIGLHQICCMLPVQFPVDIRKCKIIHKIIK